MIYTPPLTISLEALAVPAGEVSGMFPSASVAPMIDTPLMALTPGLVAGSADVSTNLCEHSSLYNNMLPVAPESEHFGDNLRCATINSRGSGDHFSKIDVVADFAEDELLDVVFVTELKTTLAKVLATKVCYRASSAVGALGM